MIDGRDGDGGDGGDGGGGAVRCEYRCKYGCGVPLPPTFDDCAIGLTESDSCSSRSGIGGTVLGLWRLWEGGMRKIQGS